MKRRVEELSRKIKDFDLIINRRFVTFNLVITFVSAWIQIRMTLRSNIKSYL